ncbi:MAG: TetR/AcrR family transcriptional regulator, partial [Solirubrobacterales bacterium]
MALLENETSTRDAALAAAAKLLAERGASGCAMRDVAEAVGIQQASLYHHFADKQALLSEVMLTALEQLTSEVLPIVESDRPPGVVLPAAIAAHVRFEGEHAEQARVCRAELRTLDPATAERVIALRDRYEDLFVAVIDRGAAAGEFEVDDSRLAVRAFLAMWSGVSIWYRPDGRLSLEQIGLIYGRLALAALVAEVPPPAAAD